MLGDRSACGRGFGEKKGKKTSKVQKDRGVGEREAEMEGWRERETESRKQEGGEQGLD